MELYSTKNPNHRVDLKEAVLRGLPPDNGLYMPARIPVLSSAFFDQLPVLSFLELSLKVCEALLENYIPKTDLRKIIETSITFPAPNVELQKGLHILELFHGPSLAFKDFGARFMARLMSYFNRNENQELVILVATSGDTGGAVAGGFLEAPGIRVVILYPKGKVSPLQEKQLTTQGKNITALEIDGVFDDCQALVKHAFLDETLRGEIRLSSANSINIARLIPQAFYYFESWKQLQPTKSPVAFSVPSGNFGNLTAGLLAQRMGLPVDQFIAATNINDVVPGYLSTGIFSPRFSRPTISNAMDVGNPSNFARMLDLFPETNDCSTWNNIKKKVRGFAFDDSRTQKAMQEVYEQFNYILDPHGAVGYLALKHWQRNYPDSVGVILETAHPAKFIETVEAALGVQIEIPERLASLKDKPKQAESLDKDYKGFKEWMLDNLKG